MTTSDTNARIHAHMAAGTLRTYREERYSGRETCVVAVVDISGKGRYRPIEIFAYDWPDALADLVSICDALPGGHRAYRVEGRAA